MSGSTPEQRLAMWQMAMCEAGYPDLAASGNVRANGAIRWDGQLADDDAIKAAHKATTLVRSALGMGPTTICESCYVVSRCYRIRCEHAPAERSSVPEDGANG